MKQRICTSALVAIAGLTVLAVSTKSVAAQNSPVATNNLSSTVIAASSPSKQVKLSYGARDVLSLWAAHASEDTIVSFIEGSGMTYNLSAPEIIYLRQQGVSDRVITTMLNHRREMAEAIARNAALLQADALVNSLSARAQDSQPETTSYQNFQTAPDTAEPSTDYVAPSSPPVYYDYNGYYPWYGGYNGYFFPGLSLSFGIGGGFYGDGFYGGGYRGRGYHRGGYHRGGHY